MVKHLKFTNEIRLEVLKENTLQNKIKFLLDFLKDTNNEQYALLRVKILNTKTELELQKIMFNMQLKSEGLGLW